VIHWLGRLKAASGTRKRPELGPGSIPTLAERIAKAGDEVANGEPRRPVSRIDVPSPDGLRNLLDMNANEVIAELAGDEASPQ